MLCLILSQVGPFQVPEHHEIIPLSILGNDQQNLEKNHSDFIRAGPCLHTYLLMVGEQRHTNIK